MPSSPAAYTGSDKYVFVAYSHRDDSLVHEEIRWLQANGLNVAYDEGVSPGSEWSDAIAERIQGCEHFLYLMTPRSVASEHCRRELNFALEENRRIIAVHLEKTTVPAGVRLSLNNRQAILKYSMDEASYKRKLAHALDATERSDTVIPRSPVRTVDRIHVLVCSSAESQNHATTLVAAIVRYLSWQGGIYRAHDLSRPASDANLHGDYRIEVSVQVNGQNAEIDWQVSRYDSGEIVWANNTSEMIDAFSRKRGRIAEMVGEGSLKTIADHELHRISGRPLSVLGYSQLVLMAEQLNYLDRKQVDERFEALKRAIELEPHSGLPHASLAGLLSWQIINGVSESPEAHSTLLDEARTALRLDGNDPAVLLSVGTTYCRIGRYESGLNLTRRAYRMAPTIAAKDQLARSLCFAGQPAEAIVLFEEILESMPAGHSFPYVRLAVALVQAGRLEDAEKNANESVLNYPDDYYGWFVHANLLDQLGREDEAREALEQGQRLIPNLLVATVIERTESTYGRTTDQRRWLTAGLRHLTTEQT